WRPELPFRQTDISRHTATRFSDSQPGPQAAAEACQGRGISDRHDVHNGRMEANREWRGRKFPGTIGNDEESECPPVKTSLLEDAAQPARRTPTVRSAARATVKLVLSSKVRTTSTSAVNALNCVSPFSIRNGGGG